MQAGNKRIWQRPFVFFTIILFLKLALLRYFLFGQLSFMFWLLDLPSVVVLTGLIDLLFRGKAVKPAYWTLNVIFSLVLFAATLYFEHFGSIVTYTSLLELKQIFKISSSVKATIRPLDFLFFADIALVLLYRLVARDKRARLIPARNLHRFAVLIVMLAGFGISAWEIRYDMGISNEIVRAERLGLINYQVSVAINGASEDSEPKFTSIEQAKLVVGRSQSRFNYSNAGGVAPLHFASQQGKNMVVLQLEAFQNFPIGLSLNGVELTPVLNKLANESFYFPHIFQQVGQGNTSDAEFMSNTSIYPTGTIAMSTGYGDRSLPSLPRLLEEAGYETDTFHVNDVHFWDRDKLYPALGFTHYYDKPNYENDQFNSFGASDEELYRVGVEHLQQMHNNGKPFYAQFITVSSHFPFTVPKDRRKITLPADLEGKQLGDYLLAINYTDYAVGTLIDRLKAAGLWDNTILVAYGDHFGLQPQEKTNDPDVLSKQLGITYHPVITRFNIPLIIHVPQQSGNQVVEQVGGQLDIMPTLTNLLGISLKDQGFLHFGQDLLNIQHNTIGIRYYMPTGSFFNDDIMFTPGKGFEDGTAVSLKTLQPVADITPYLKDYNYIMRLMKMSDDYVKLLPKRTESAISNP